MGRYTGPKARINRKLGQAIFENPAVLRSAEKHDYAPGHNGFQRGFKLSQYGTQLREKQKLKFYYGLMERQLRRYFQNAKAFKGNTGTALLVFCERRLDNVIYLLGFTKTRPQARQVIVHKQVLVNGKRVDVPSYLVDAGDVIEITKKEAPRKAIQAWAKDVKRDTPQWLKLDKDGMKGEVQALPTRDDVTLPVNENAIVEHLSR
jgi:small subunit ribosomal protein S4